MIDFKETVHLRKGQVNWDNVVKRLEQMSKEPDRVFSPLFLVEGMS
jgi:hypothetical protein